MTESIDLHSAQQAHERIRALARRTPVLTSGSLDRLSGARCFFKCENFQRAGAFKFRGAANAVLQLSPEEARQGVVTHSSGNHGAALALAAKLRGIPAYVIMPSNAVATKRRAVEEYGGRVIACEPTITARTQAMADVTRSTGAIPVHPYNDPRVIAGQATVALELLAQVDALDVVVAPVGGGGLLAGTAIATAGVAPATKVIGVEPRGADDAFRSMRAGRLLPGTGNPPVTIADGLRAPLGDLTFPIIHRLVEDIVTVSESAIVEAMRIVWERMKIVIEPSAAVVVAALLLEHRRLFTGRKIGAIFSGGNVDLRRLPWPCHAASGVD